MVSEIFLNHPTFAKHLWMDKATRSASWGLCYSSSGACSEDVNSNSSSCPQPQWHSLSVSTFVRAMFPESPFVLSHWASDMMCKSSPFGPLKHSKLKTQTEHQICGCFVYISFSLYPLFSCVWLGSTSLYFVCIILRLFILVLSVAFCSNLITLKCRAVLKSPHPWNILIPTHFLPRLLIFLSSVISYVIPSAP